MNEDINPLMRGHCSSFYCRCPNEKTNVPYYDYFILKHTKKVVVKVIHRKHLLCLKG